MGTFLMLAICSIALQGCGNRKSDPATKTGQPLIPLEFTQLETESDVQAAVDEATSHQHTIIFVHVDWAPMFFQRQRFAEFKQAFQAKYPGNDLAFRYIDCTPVTDGYKPLRSLAGWKELKESKGNNSLVHGYGELAWVRNRHVMHVERPLDFSDANALIEKTESLAMTENAE